MVAAAVVEGDFGLGDGPEPAMAEGRETGRLLRVAAGGWWPPRLL